MRSRVVNPKWIAAMQRHGYKGAFELAATVDYLFGYDATAHVVDDWMYERVTEAYVADPDVRKFFGARTRGRCVRSPSGCSRRTERGMWAGERRRARHASLPRVLEAEGWEESR